MDGHIAYDYLEYPEGTSVEHFFENGRSWTEPPQDHSLYELTAHLYDLCFRYADTFSFTIQEYWHNLPLGMKQRENLLRDRLRPYFVKKFQTYDWYGWNDSDMEIFVYRCCDETKAILHALCPEIFIRPAEDRFHRLQYPEFEDLCFYRNGRLLLGTVSHEYMCSIYPPVSSEGTPDPAFMEELQKVGYWKKCVYPTPHTLPE